MAGYSGKVYFCWNCDWYGITDDDEQCPECDAVQKIKHNAEDDGDGPDD